MGVDQYCMAFSSARARTMGIDHYCMAFSSARARTMGVDQYCIRPILIAWLNIDIAAISEVCFGEPGILIQHGAGFTLYWYREGKDGCIPLKVGFMRHFIISKLKNLPKIH